MYNPRLNALVPLPHDPRDFSHSAVFGSLSPADLPTHDFLVAVPLEMKNQDINYPSDYCTSYAASECAEDEDQVIFVPEYTFAKAKQLLALRSGPQAYSQYGLSLRDICAAACEIGFLPRIHDPLKCNTTERPDRATVINPASWPGNLDTIAQKYKKASYFSVDGPYDMFDNIRSTLHINLAERRSVILGCLWRESWSHAADGIIPEAYEPNGYGHAIKICGQKTINGILYLIAQMSDGDTFGDKGYCYFSRAVVNREFANYGAFTFSHMPPDEAQWHVNTGVSINDSWLLKTIRIISKYIHI